MEGWEVIEGEWLVEKGEEGTTFPKRARRRQGGKKRSRIENRGGENERTKEGKEDWLLEKWRPEKTGKGMRRVEVRKGGLSWHVLPVGSQMFIHECCLMNNGIEASNPIIYSSHWGWNSDTRFEVEEGLTGQEKGGEEDSCGKCLMLTYSTMMIQRPRTEEKIRASERRQESHSKVKNCNYEESKMCCLEEWFRGSRRGGKWK